MRSSWRSGPKWTRTGTSSLVRLYRPVSTTTESLPSSLQGHRWVFLSTAPTTGMTLSARKSWRLPRIDALLVHGELDDLVGLRLRGFGDHGEHAQGEPLFVLRASGRNRRSGRPGRSTARPRRPADRRSRRCRLRRSRSRRSRSRPRRRSSRSSCRPWPRLPWPRPWRRRPTCPATRRRDSGRTSPDVKAPQRV